jgi:hypothetical protein
VDVATKENLENLVKVGEKLLEKPVSRVNLATGVFEPINKMTNEEALTKYIYTPLNSFFLYLFMLKHNINHILHLD